MVDLSLSPASDPLRLVASPGPTPAAVFYQAAKPEIFRDLPIGSRVEISPASWMVATKLSQLFRDGTSSGAGLIVDYGGAKWYSDSFRVRNQTQFISYPILTEIKGIQGASSCVSSR
jgi:NADH dehydrogenase [ubiquinone] 1 alpha subcomplex assembly factor 7